MKRITQKSLLEEFQREELQKSELIKGGPETSRGTETEVQDDDD